MNRGYQVSIHSGFVDKSQRAFRQAGNYEFLVRVDGQENNPGARTSLADLMNSLDAVQLGQADIGDNDVRIESESLPDQRCSVLRSSQYIKKGPQEGDFCIGKKRMVIGD